MNKGGIVVCKYCGGDEWWGRMIWLSGRYMCRKCYRRIMKRRTESRMCGKT